MKQEICQGCGKIKSKLIPAGKSKRTGKSYDAFFACGFCKEGSPKREGGRLGALWAKKTTKQFLSGNIEINGEKINIVVFRNDNKKDDRQPDYYILKAKTLQPKKTTDTISEQDEQDYEDYHNEQDLKSAEKDLPF